MKKIKRKTQEIGRVEKEFSATRFFYSQRVKIIGVLGLGGIVILCTTLLWVWFHHREIEAGFSLSQARDMEDYKQIASGFSFTKTKPLAMIALARKLYDEGRYVEAISIYKEFIEQYPKHKLVPPASISLAYCYEELGDTKEAENLFMRVKEEFPNTIWAKEAEEGYKRVS